MRASLAGLFVWMAVGLVAAGQEPAAAGKFITLDIVVADVAEGLPASPTAAAILELEKAGKLSGWSKFRLTALENQRSQLQFGGHVPLVSGRNFAGGGRGGFGQGGATYTQISVGTLISAVARVEESGTVVAELKFERSSVAPRPAEAAEADADAGAPQSTATVSVQTTVRVKPGEPLLVGGRQTGGKEAGQTWLVLTASVAAAPKPEVVEPKPAAAAKEPIDELKIVQLKHAAAAALANVLHDTFAREPIRIAVDERTNSLLLRGTPARLEVVLALIARLDEP